MIALWTAAMYLLINKKNYWICAIPATFMSGVSMTYFIAAPECMGLLWTPMGLASGTVYTIALIGGLIIAALFFGLFWKAAKARQGSLAYVFNPI